jgi:enterobactin synthetase component D
MSSTRDIFQYSVSYPLNDKERLLFEKVDLKIPDSLQHAHENRRLQFLIGRFCAYQSLREAGFNESFDLPIDPHGAPLWPKGFVGSITHTTHFIAAAVASTKTHRGLGIDAQLIMSEQTFQTIKGKILNPSEAMITIDGWKPEELATLIFSFKESIYKCLRPLCGNFFGFTDAEITHIDTNSNEINFRILNDIGNGFDGNFEGSGTFQRSKTHFQTMVEFKN